MEEEEEEEEKKEKEKKEEEKESIVSGGEPCCRAHYSQEKQTGSRIGFSLFPISSEVLRRERGGGESTLMSLGTKLDLILFLW